LLFAPEWVDIFKFYILKPLMFLYTILGLLIWGMLWYIIAYSRFGNAKIIEELRTSYARLEEDLQQQMSQTSELTIQNKILKSRAQQLLDQNEDYSRVISQLSRFYFRLKEVNWKLKELTSLVAVVDEEDLAKKIPLLAANEEWVDEEDELIFETDTQKKFF